MKTDESMSHLMVLYSRGQCYKTLLSVIYKFLHEARVFVRVGLKILPGTNTLAYYENA
jgi:hypothetical protein